MVSFLLYQLRDDLEWRKKNRDIEKRKSTSRGQEGVVQADKKQKNQKTTQVELQRKYVVC